MEKIKGRVDAAQCLSQFTGACIFSEDRSWNLNSKFLIYLLKFAKTVFPWFLLLIRFMVLHHSEQGHS